MIEELFMRKESTITGTLLQYILVILLQSVLQSKVVKLEVVNMLYTVRDTFLIIFGTGRGGYIVRKLNKSDKSEFNFISEDLYVLPSSLKTYELMDGSDIRYLNHSHVPIVNPLKKPLILSYIMKNGLAHHPQYSLHHSNMITLHYSFLQLLQLPSLVSPTFITKQILLLHYCFSNTQMMTIVPLLHQLLYINHSFIQTVYYLSSILLRIHLNRVGFQYKLTWTRPENQT